MRPAIPMAPLIMHSPLNSAQACMGITQRIARLTTTTTRSSYRKGQRLTVEVWSSCLGFQHFRGMSDIAVTVYGPDQKKVAYADDTSLRGMDPILNMTAPESGTYFVNIHQSMDFEGILRHYVAHFSDAPRPMITYPLGGQAGTALQATAIGDIGGPSDIKLLVAQPSRCFREIHRMNHYMHRHL